MDHNLLVAARSEYTDKLQDILCESICSGIKEIWEKCKSEHKNNPLSNFQKKLCLIPEWNQEVINTQLKKIINKNNISNDYLDKIIEAVFLSNVKILSVVKLNNSKQTIDVKVPDTKNFIHRCFIESARRFYRDPYLIDDRESGSNTKQEINRNVKRCNSTINDSIDKTIRGMIPMEDILNKYLKDQCEIDSEASSIENYPEPIFEEVQPSFETINDAQEQENNSESKNEEDLFQERPCENLVETPTGEINSNLQEKQDIFEEPLQSLQEQEKLHIDLKEPEKNFFSDSE